MKRQIFLVCLFYCFFRLPIYESIAAIFWQSASYVIKMGILYRFRLQTVLGMEAQAKRVHGDSSMITESNLVLEIQSPAI